MSEIFLLTNLNRNYNCPISQPRNKSSFKGCSLSCRSGNIRLEVKFSQATMFPLEMLVFSEHHSTMTIDNDRNVKVAYVPAIKTVET